MTSEQDTLDLGIELPGKQSWREEAMEVLLRVAARGRPFQPYDLTLEGLGDPPHHNSWGSLFRTAANEGHISPIRFTYSSRPTRSAGVTREWIGTEFTKQAHQLVA